MAEGMPTCTEPFPCQGSRSERITGETSDGYHTFNELYEHRHALFAALLHSYPSMAFKTWRNHKLEVWEGWFIAGLNTEKGQITYHMPASWWDKLHVEEIGYNGDYDGHTSADVLERLEFAARRLIGSGQSPSLQEGAP